MADQKENTIVSELDERLDSLFGEDVGDLDILEGSPLEGLKSLVMTIDWEISEGTLNALMNELNSLRNQYAGDKPVSILLKMMTSLSSYIQKRKGGSHPDSIQLFHAVAKDLASIVEEAGMDPRKKNAIVKRDIDRFHSLKGEIVGGGKKQTVSPPPEEPPVVEEEAPVFEPASDAQETAPSFEPEPPPLSEPEEYPTAPPESEEHPASPEGTIEFEEAVEPEMETAETAEPEEEKIPEYEMEETSEADLEQILRETSEMVDAPEIGEAQEIGESTMEDLKELDEIFKEELSRAEEPLEEPGFEPIPSPEELGIAEGVSMEEQIEEAEPELETDQEDLPKVFEVSEEPVEEVGTLFAEQPSVPLSEPVAETVEIEPIPQEPGKAEAALPGEAPPPGPATLTAILVAIQSLGRELRHDLQELRSDVGETKARLNRLLESRTEFSPPDMFESTTEEPFEIDFQPGEDDEERLFSGEGLGGDVSKETEKRISLEETSLEDIFEDAETSGEQEEPGEETKTLQELFEEAVAPKTAEEAEAMDFEFEGEDEGPEVSERAEDLSSDKEMEEIGTVSELESEPDFVAVNLAGREYLLPSEYVVKIGKLKDKTRAKILKSGAAAMSDLRGPFQSLKKDVFPAWEHLSQKELRQLSFPVVSVDVGDSEDQAEVRGVVLLKIGDRCGALFTNDVPLRLGADDAEGVESLDVEQLLSSTQNPVPAGDDVLTSD